MIAEPDAGHGLGPLVPYQPRPEALTGPNQVADQDALGRVWPQVLTFLDAGSP